MKCGEVNDDENEGVVKTYDFNVAFKRPYDKNKEDGEENREETKEGDEKVNVRKDGRKYNKDRGHAFNSGGKKFGADGLDDDGFEVV